MAEQMTQQAKEKVKELKERGVNPVLAVLRIGAQEDDLSYERGILKRFGQAGAEVRVTELPAGVTQEAAERELIRLNEDSDVHGILIFRPLPRQLDEKRFCQLIDPAKDVDGMSPASAAKIYLGERDGFAPCTAAAVLAILEHYRFDLTGVRATVVGRSAVIGRPVAMMLLAKHATVTVCHTRTRDLKSACRNAELIVAAAGVPRMIGDAYLTEGQSVVDVGIHMTDDGLCGDVDEHAQTALAARTPVPGGVGSVTTSVLLQHTLQAAERAADRS